MLPSKRVQQVMSESFGVIRMRMVLAECYGDGWNAKGNPTRSRSAHMLIETAMSDRWLSNTYLLGERSSGFGVLIDPDGCVHDGSVWETKIPSPGRTGSTFSPKIEMDSFVLELRD